MINHGKAGRKRIQVTLVSVLMLVLLMLVSGCSHAGQNPGWTVKPGAFESPAGEHADETTSSVTIPLNGSFLVSYPWSPERGNFWRISVSEGLIITGDRYVPYPPDIPVSESGVREWMVKAVVPGEQTFIANLRSRIPGQNTREEKKILEVFVSPGNVVKE